MPLIRKTPEPSPDPPEAGDILTALTSGTSEERWTAARGAAEVPGGIEALGRALATEEDARVREAIFTSLARLGTSECVERVLPHLRSEDASVRTGALDCLRAMPQAAQSKLPQLLEDRDPDVRLLACDLARAIPEPEVVRLLCRLLDCELDTNVSAAAVEVLAEIGGPEALASLARCADRFPDDPFLGFAVRVAVGRIGIKPAEPRD